MNKELLNEELSPADAAAFEQALKKLSFEELLVLVLDGDDSQEAQAIWDKLEAERQR